MGNSIYTLSVGTTPSSWTALGYTNNGASILHLGSGTSIQDGTLRLKLDPALTPTVVLGNDEGECTRLRLKRGNNVINTVGAMPAGNVSDEFDPLRAEIERAMVRLSGRINYDSGSASCILHIASGYRPAESTSISAIQVGPSLCTATAAIIGTDGWVKLSGAAPAPTSSFDVILDGDYPVA